MTSEAQCLDDFQAAWENLRRAVKLTRQGGERSDLVAAVDEAVNVRTRAREFLANKYDGYWVGDQVLFEREVAVGALARELDGFVERWPIERSRLATDGILAQVEPLCVEPGSHEAHQPS